MSGASKRANERTSKQANGAQYSNQHSKLFWPTVRLSGEEKADCAHLTKTHNNAFMGKSIESRLTKRTSRSMNNGENKNKKNLRSIGVSDRMGGQEQ